MSQHVQQQHHTAGHCDDCQCKEITGGTRDTQYYVWRNSVAEQIFELGCRLLDIANGFEHHHITQQKMEDKRDDQ